MNKTFGFEQKRLGYLVFDGKEMPIITERLRNVPLDAWLSDDTSEEFGAQAELDRQRVRQYAQRANEIEWLCAVIRPLAERYDAPNAPMGELIKLLPEPDRTRAEAIMHAKVPLNALPLERLNRQPWHGNIEDAIFTLIHKDEFGIDDILAEARIAKNSIERPAAKAYAVRIMDVLTNYPATANVAVPVMMSQQSNEVQ